MTNKIRMWVVAAVFAAGLTVTVRADEISDLRKQMEQQYEQMRQMQNKLIELESSQKKQSDAVQKLEESGTMTLPENLAWLEDIKFYGDFRYRYEYRDRDWSSSSSNRHRIRARVGLKYDINDEFMFDFRVATAEFFDDEDDNTTIGGDYVSGNKSLGDYWASKNLWVDRAYVAYTPNWTDGVTALFGKMGNPFYKVGKNQLIWDGDLNPEGIAFQYTTGDLFVNGMFGLVQENGSDSDKEMLGIQAGLVHAFADESKLTYGAGYFDYTNVKGEEAIVGDAFAGNTSTDGTTYDYDYNMVEIFGEYGTKVGKMPVSVYGNYVVNVASGVTEDTGWLIGTKLGKASNPGSWEFNYNYRNLEADAVFGAFTDSDFADGGTNAKGHVFGIGYALAKNTTLAATYFLNDALDEKPDDGYQRLQLDLSIKF